MPFTPYHFGPGAFFGLVFRKWIDVPVFLLANIVVDLEVLFFNSWPQHRYFHTLLIGAAAGAAWGLFAYPLRNIFGKIMLAIHLPHQTTLPKMIISGILGIWLHVLIDAIYHWDVRIFWPSKAKPLWQLVSQERIEILCAAFFFAALILYAIVAVSHAKWLCHAIGKEIGPSGKN